MQRQIKFRAWDETEMIYPKSIGTDEYFKGVIILDGWATNQSDTPLMQYTGLKDKNGVEIYEGDVLGGTYEPLQVEWCYNQGGYELHDMNECYACNGDIFWHEVAQDNSGVEVIGNIYEHGHLLK